MPLPEDTSKHDPIESEPPVPSTGPEQGQDDDLLRANRPALTLRPQEISIDHPHSHCMFVPSNAKPFVATPGAIEAFGVETIIRCLVQLQVQARLHNGLDYIQVFQAEDGGKLWFIEDGPGGAITALLPHEY